MRVAEYMYTYRYVCNISANAQKFAMFALEHFGICQKHITNISEPTISMTFLIGSDPMRVA